MAKNLSHSRDTLAWIPMDPDAPNKKGQLLYVLSKISEESMLAIRLTDKHTYTKLSRNLDEITPSLSGSLIELTPWNRYA